MVPVLACFPSWSLSRTFTIKKTGKISFLCAGGQNVSQCIEISYSSHRQTTIEWGPHQATHHSKYSIHLSSSPCNEDLPFPASQQNIRLLTTFGFCYRVSDLSATPQVSIAAARRVHRLTRRSFVLQSRLRSK